jgi:hypothetical protein
MLNSDHEIIPQRRAEKSSSFTIEIFDEVRKYEE